MKKNKTNLLKLKLTPLYQIVTVKKNANLQLLSNLPGDTIFGTISTSF